MVKAKLKGANAFQYWPVSNGMGVHGIPDVLGCLNGRFFGIEVKAPGRRNEERRGCSALQELRGKEIIASGGVWCVVDCEEEMDEFLLAIMLI